MQDYHSTKGFNVKKVSFPVSCIVWRQQRRWGMCSQRSREQSWILRLPLSSRPPHYKIPMQGPWGVVEGSPFRVFLVQLIAFGHYFVTRNPPDTGCNHRCTQSKPTCDRLIVLFYFWIHQCYIRLCRLILASFFYHTIVDEVKSLVSIYPYCLKLRRLRCWDQILWKLV